MRTSIKRPIEQYIDKHKIIFTKEKPSILFHYTNLSGAVGILKSKELWLSKISYLNDHTEGKFFFDKIYLIIESLISFDISSNLLNEVKNILKTIRIDYYVGSFCENGNLLSQWRAYTNDTIGISLGFNTEKLNDIVKKDGLHIIPCIYDEDEQSGIAISLILKLIEELKKDDKDLTVIKEEFILATLACKHPSFSEEKEWRIVLKSEMYPIGKNFDVKFSKTQLIPYYKFKLPEWNQKSIIERCYIGPKTQFYDVHEGLQMLIQKNIGTEFSMHESDIPYR